MIPHTFSGPLEFRIAIHSITRLPMIEIHGDGKFIGAIYQQANGLRFLSKYPVDVVTAQTSVQTSVVLLNFRSLD